MTLSTQSQSMNSTQPIISLTPFQQNHAWKVKGTVVTKSALRSPKAGNSDRKFFDFTLRDDTESIRVTCWGDKLFNLIEVNKSYMISKGSIRQANRKFNPLPNEYEIILGDESEVTPVDFVVPVGQTTYSFVNINQLATREAGIVVDICGVVTEVSPQVVKVVTRNQEQVSKLSITVGDKTNLVELTIWGDAAEKFSHPLGTVVAIRGARIGHFGTSAVTNQKCTQLSLTKDGSLTVLGNDHQLASKYKQLKALFDSQDFSELENVSKTNAGQHVAERRTLSYITDKDLGNSVDNKGEPKSDFITIRGHISIIKQSDMFYGSDKDGKKSNDVTPYDYRYLTHLVVSDHTKQQWVTMFNDAARLYFQCDAKALKKLKDEDEGTNTSPSKGVTRGGKLDSYLRPYTLSGPVVCTLRAKQEEYMGDKRLRCSIQRIQRPSKTPSWKKECSVLIRDINRYIIQHGYNTQ